MASFDSWGGTLHIFPYCLVREYTTTFVRPTTFQGEPSKESTGRLQATLKSADIKQFPQMSLLMLAVSLGSEVNEAHANLFF